MYSRYCGSYFLALTTYVSFSVEVMEGTKGTHTQVTSEVAALQQANRTAAVRRNNIVDSVIECAIFSRINGCDLSGSESRVKSSNDSN
jgi:hypothetical protein